MINIEQVLLATVDPLNTLGGKRTPALTTLLIKVCDNNGSKFDEAIRLIELFINKAVVEIIA